MRQRQINYLRHPMSSRQALSMLLDMWAEKRNAPILLVAPRGMCMNIIKRIRVALSKERFIHRGKKSKIHFGFITSEPFPYTMEGVTGEAIVIYWRLTRLQQMRNLSSELFRKDSIDANRPDVV